MVVDTDAAKHMRCANASEDRLSSFHDDILIRIMSLLPFPYVVVTACLSTHWRGLWTQLTSINITKIEPETSLKFITTVKHLLRRITSPVYRTIDSFSVELDSMPCYVDWTINSWIESLTNKYCINVRNVKTLVSLDLNRIFDFDLYNKQLPSDNDEINLPNLTTLRLGCQILVYSEWLKKLIKSCPSLENLDLLCEQCFESGTYIECSNQNLRSLIIDMSRVGADHTVVINAPKLDYLSIHGSRYSTFRFDNVPISLCEASITISNEFWDKVPIQQLSTMFQSVTRLTIDIRSPINIQTVLSLVELCPRLNFLTLRFYPPEMSDARCDRPKPGALQSSPKRLHLEIYGYPYDWPLNLYKTVEYWSCNAINLVHFRFDLTNSQGFINESVEALKRRELKWCERLYKYPVASTACEVEFVGKFFKRSQKADPKACRENREVIHLSCAP